MWPPGFADGVTFVFEQEIDGFEEHDGGGVPFGEGIQGALREQVQRGGVGHMRTVLSDQGAEVGGVAELAVGLTDLAAAVHKLVFADEADSALFRGFQMNVGAVEQVGRGNQVILFGGAFKAEKCAAVRRENVEFLKRFARGGDAQHERAFGDCERAHNSGHTVGELDSRQALMLQSVRGMLRHYRWLRLGY